MCSTRNRGRLRVTERAVLSQTANLRPDHQSCAGRELRLVLIEGEKSGAPSTSAEATCSRSIPRCPCATVSSAERRWACSCTAAQSQSVPAGTHGAFCGTDRWLHHRLISSKPPACKSARPASQHPKHNHYRCETRQRFAGRVRPVVSFETKPLSDE